MPLKDPCERGIATDSGVLKKGSVQPGGALLHGRWPDRRYSENHSNSEYSKAYGEESISSRLLRTKPHREPVIRRDSRLIAVVLRRRIQGASPESAIRIAGLDEVFSILDRGSIARATPRVLCAPSPGI